MILFVMRGESCAESTHDRGGSLPALKTGLPEYIGREVACMTAYEIVMVVLGILALLVSSGGLLIALLTFLDKRNKRKK